MNGNGDKKMTTISKSTNKQTEEINKSIDCRQLAHTQKESMDCNLHYQNVE